MVCHLLLVLRSPESSNLTLTLTTAIKLRPLRKFKAHSNTSQNFIRAKFAHSTLLVSGSEDGILYLWDRESSEVLQRLEGHEGVVSTCLPGHLDPSAHQFSFVVDRCMELHGVIKQVF